MVTKSLMDSEQIEAPALITGEELFHKGDLGRTELVKGEIVYMLPTGRVSQEKPPRFSSTSEVEF